MILKYLIFFFSVLGIYFLIKTQSIFSKKTGILFTIFVSKISWLTLLITTYHAYKNFTLFWFLLGLAVPILIIEASFKFLISYIKNKFPRVSDNQALKTVIEYLIIFLILKYVFF